MTLDICFKLKGCMVQKKHGLIVRAISLMVGVLIAGCGGGGSTAPSITVTSPNGGEEWYYQGADEDITWTSAGFTGDVDIYYSTDNGTTWPSVAFNVANTGTYTWTIPNANSTECFIRIQQAGGTGPNDTSDAVFSILPQSITVTSPNGTENWVVGTMESVTWTTAGVANVRIELSRNNGSTWADIAASVDATLGTYSWTVTTPGSLNCKVRVSDVLNPTLYDQSDAVFSISEITVFAPNGGEYWYFHGEKQNISWSAPGVTGNVDIEYSVDNGTSWSTVALNTANTSPYLWTIPDEDSDQCLVRIQETGGGASDVSNATFTIAPSTITVTSPNGSENWLEGSSQAITWTSTGVTNVNISISRDGGNSWQLVAISTDAAAGMYSWTTALPSSTNCIIRVADSDHIGNSDWSDAVFTITPLLTDITAGLMGISSGQIAWGDYDNDNDLDLLVVGYTSAIFSALYRNDAGVFNDASAGIAPSYLCSVAWGDYDNDGDLDIALEGQGSGTHLYQNNAGVFADIANTITGLVEGSVGWGDYDNDGDLDLALTGVYGFPATRNSSVWKNTAGVFTNSGASLGGTEWGSLEWGDYDNDGDLDLVIAGEISSGTMCEVYENTTGTFASAASLTGITMGDVAWGDYDSDGDLDLAIVGGTTTSYPFSPTCRIYRNDSGTFVDISAPISGLYSASLDWGDYDNDGDLDLIVCGMSNSSYYSRLYRNDGSDTFTNTNAELFAAGQSSVEWGDYDNDGDLDLAIAGAYDTTSETTRIYRNNSATANTAPSAPTGLSTSVAGGGPYNVTFSWTSSTDTDETPQDGLSYNLRVGTTSGGNQIYSSMSSASGLRKIPNRGAIQPGTSTNQWTLSLPAGTYYWSVQAIDAGLKGSAWAGEATITVP